MMQTITICPACLGEIPEGAACAVHIATGTQFHIGCDEKRHTFYKVDFDGDGGPSFEDHEGAEAFIKEEVENHGDPEITADLFTIGTFEMTWFEWLNLGEWDGY